MELSKVEKAQMKKFDRKAAKGGLRSDEYYKWLPVAMEHLSRTTFDHRVQSKSPKFDTMEKCATLPLDSNKANGGKRGVRLNQKPIAVLCQEYGVPRVSFYKWRNRQLYPSKIAALPNAEQVAMYAEARRQENER